MLTPVRGLWPPAYGSTKLWPGHGTNGKLEVGGLRNEAGGGRGESSCGGESFWGGEHCQGESGTGFASGLGQYLVEPLSVQQPLCNYGCCSSGLSFPI